MSESNHDISKLDLILERLSEMEKQISALRTVVNASPGMRTVQVSNNIGLVRLAGGNRLYVDTRDIGIASHLMIRGSWESHYTRIVSAIVKKGDVTVDVGANFGYYSVLFGSLVKEQGKVFSFEPNPYLYDLLCRSMRVNGYQMMGISQVFNLALSDKKSTVELYFKEGDFGGGTVHEYITSKKNKNVFQSTQVETTTLDSVLPKDICVDFCKIDVEGSEYLALNGMRNVISRSPKFKALIEFTPTFIKKTTTIKKFWSFFETLDLRVYHASNLGLRLLDETQFNNLSNCYILASKDPDLNPNLIVT